MKKQEILSQLFQKILHVKLELLENSNASHKVILNQCNLSINSIIVDNEFLFKKEDSNRSENNTLSSTTMKTSLNSSNLMNMTKSTNCSDRKVTDPKIIIKQSGQDLIKKKPKENIRIMTKDLIRSNTKVTLQRPKETKSKIEIESIIYL